MPELPAQIHLPRPTSDDPVALQRWADEMIGIVTQSWRTLIFTVNALSRVDTSANRPTTPDLNDLFFTESDTGLTYVAVDGAWVSLMTGGVESDREYALILC